MASAKLTRFRPNVTYRSSETGSASDLISFSDRIYKKYKNSGNLYYKFVGRDSELGFIAYKIQEDKINVSELYVESKNLARNRYGQILGSLIDILSNDASALGIPLVIENIDAKLEQYLKDINNFYKEQKIEEIYRWKIE